MTNFSEQYKDPRWQRKRLEILNRDCFRCVNCLTDKGYLHVHHTFYVPSVFVWDYSNESLITLCDKCHKQAHELKDKIKSMIDLDFQKPNELKELILLIEKEFYEL